MLKWGGTARDARLLRAVRPRDARCGILGFRVEPSAAVVIFGWSHWGFERIKLWEMKHPFWYSMGSSSVKIHSTPVFVLLLLRLTGIWVAPLCAQISGGFTAIVPTDESAVAAARTAVAACEGQMQLLKIERADRQVVAGANYRLVLSVLRNGATCRAEASVWQKLDGSFEVRSWTWMDESRFQSGFLKSEFIYEVGPYPQVHASTLVETPTGLVAAWFGGTHERHPDVGIWVARLEDGKWTESVEVANGVQSDGKRHPTWNPVLFQPKDSPLMIFYKVGPSPEQWWGEFKTSADGGRTWSTAVRLPEGILGPIKNKPVQLSNGDILCPTSLETHEKPSKWSVYFERSSDRGVTWQKTALVNDGAALQAIQPSILFLGGDRLLAIGRSRQDRVFEVRSEDGGKTWGPMGLGTLPNNNSGTDAVTLCDGRHLIVYNHVAGTPGKWGGKRTPLNIAVSSNAREWSAALVLERDQGEYSYPAVIQTHDGIVHVTYTWKRQRVKHVVIDPVKFVTEPIIDDRWPE